MSRVEKRVAKVARPRVRTPTSANRRALANVLRARERELEAVEAVGLAISEVLSAAQIGMMLDVVVGRAKELVAADVASLTLVDASGCQTVRGSSGIRTPAFLHIRIPFGVGVDGSVLATGCSKRVGDYLTDPTISHELDPIVGAEGVRACMSVPFFVDGTVAGTLNVGRREVRPFSQGDESLLARLAMQTTVAVKIARLCHEVQALEAERTALLRERLIGIARAREAERKRIARELHDDLGQTLSGLVVNLEASSSQAAVPPSVRRALEECAAAARGALRSVRGWLGELRAPTLDPIDLAVALRSDLLPSFEAESGCATALEVTGWPADLPGEVTFNLYRIFQESLSNVRRHAGASCVEVRLAAAGERLVVSIRDDGIGFDVDAANQARADADGSGSAGFGLIGMRERAALLGGELRVQAVRGRGTSVTITIPRSWSQCSP